MEYGMLLSLMLAAAVVNQPTASQVKDICSMDVEGRGMVLQEIRTFDVSKVNSVTNFQLRLINRYLASMLDEKKSERSLEEIQKMLKPGGELEYQEVHFNTLKSRITNDVYFEVISFPGDNPVSDFFDRTGKRVGHNSDETIGVLDKSGKIIWCSDLEKKK
ncbi:MAG: hypothetical protein BroJett040_16170 [Oligoflexia bacterium]|nr:MAG: hypothetical protein BroJett040_16170 [Oligoflexia bacterium]